jgi:hypothetical protein
LYSGNQETLERYWYEANSTYVNMRILGKGATKLNTIFRDNSVNVKAIVAILLYKINEIATAKRVSE